MRPLPPRGWGYSVPPVPNKCVVQRTLVFEPYFLRVYCSLDTGGGLPPDCFVGSGGGPMGVLGCRRVFGLCIC